MSKNNRTTFGQLDKVLRDLGFERKVVRGTGISYRHPTTDSLLLVKPHKPADVVPQYVMVATRLQLDRQGVVEATDFEEMLKNTAAA